MSSPAENASGSCGAPKTIDFALTPISLDKFQRTGWLTNLHDAHLHC
jgi:hypothetical protein